MYKNFILTKLIYLYIHIHSIDYIVRMGLGYCSMYLQLAVLFSFLLLYVDGTTYTRQYQKECSGTQIFNRQAGSGPNAMSDCENMCTSEPQCKAVTWRTQYS